MNTKIKMQFPELNYNFDYSTIEIDEQYSIAFTDEGEGRSTLLFIHGLSSYIPAWSKLIPMLKNNFRCVAIDLPGYGKSSAAPHSGSMKFYAQSVNKFISKMNMKNVFLIGHSMGGQISITTALEYPTAVKGLILLATAGFEIFNEDESAKLKRIGSAETYSKFNDEQIRINYEMNFFNMPQDVQAMIEDRIKMKSWRNFMNYCGVVSNSLAGMLDFPVFEKLNQIKIPTYVLFGKEDKLIPNQILHPGITPEIICKSGTAKIPNSKCYLIDYCGHFIQFEKPNEVAQIIKECFKNQSERS